LRLEAGAIGNFMQGIGLTLPGSPKLISVVGDTLLVRRGDLVDPLS